MNNDLKQQDKRLQDETFEKNEIKANAQRMGQDLHMLDWLYGQIKNDVRALQTQVIATKDEAAILGKPPSPSVKTDEYTSLRNVGLNRTGEASNSNLTL